jgi:hypothetical protein
LLYVERGSVPAALERAALEAIEALAGVGVDVADLDAHSVGQADRYTAAIRSALGVDR